MGQVRQVGGDGGQHIGDADKGVQVVEADDPAVLRHPDPLRFQGLHDLPGQHVVSRDHGGEGGGFLECPGDDGPDRLLPVIGIYQLFVKGHIEFRVSLPDAPDTFMGKREMLFREDNVQDAAMSLQEQMPGGYVSRVVFVLAHLTEGRLHRNQTDLHEGDMVVHNQLQVVRPKLGGADNGVHIFADRGLHRPFLVGTPLVGDEHQGGIAAVVEMCRQMIHQVGIIRVDHFAKDDGNAVGPAGTHGTGEGIGDIPHVLGHLLNHLPGLQRDAVLVLEGS